MSYKQAFMNNLNVRPLYAIAHEIRSTWDPVNWTALPYLRAMFDCELITDQYGSDSARSIVAYFLSNAATWRGPDAKRIKAELRSMLK